MFDVQCSTLVFSGMTCVLVLRNRQRTRALNVPLLRRITRSALDNDLGVASYELGVHLVEPEEMAGVNQQFLGHEGSTDVITFDHSHDGAPASDSARRTDLNQHAGSETGAPMLHGEIFISVADAVKQARAFSTTWQAELVRYIIHGILHLRGHDDLQPAKRRVMKREENRLVKRIASQFTLKELARTRNSKLETRSSP